MAKTRHYPDSLQDLPPRTRARAIRISDELSAYMDEESAMEIGMFKAKRDAVKVERISV